MKKRAFKKLYNELFYISKHEKLSDKVFRCRMVLSLLTILACTTVMAASTFALFYVDISTDSSTIAGAYYSVIVDNTENSTYICPLAYEDKYTFEIKADGTATTGYCKIQVGETVYYTEKIPQGSSLTLTIQAAKDTPIIFTPQWGTSSDYENAGIYEKEIIHSTTPYTTYTVEPTAKLANIAAHYGVTEEDILVYNNLSDASVVDVEGENATSVLSVGMELKIPNPAENVEPYKVPYATYIVEPTATLDAISEYYGISVADILSYNGITELVARAELRIPGVTCDTVPYVAPIPEPSAGMDENKENETSSESTDSPVIDDNTLSYSDAGTNEQKLEESPATETTATEDTISVGDTGTGGEPAEDTTVQEPVNEE